MDAPPLVRVEWWDHCEEGPVWWNLTDARDARLARCTTVGYLVHQDKQRVVVSSTVVQDTEECARPLVLHRPSVIDVTRLTG